MTENRGHRKPYATRSRTPTTRSTIRKAEEAAARLLPAAELQAEKREPRLIAEIFRFLRPNKPIILQVRTPRRPRHR
jgi:hypothetical protein